MPLEQTMERAVRECIADGVLADFLRENRAEIVKMELYEYDEEECRRMEREYILERTNGAKPKPLRFDLAPCTADDRT